MNVGFVSDSFPMGGIAKVVTEIGAAIEEEGFSSFYLSALGDPTNYYSILESKLYIPEKKIEETNFIKYRDKARKFFEMKLYNGQVDLSKYLLAQYENIVNFVNKNNLDYLIICRYDLTFLVSKIKNEFPKLKIFVWIHGPVEIYTKKKERKKYLTYYKKNLLACNKVICLTEFDLHELEKIDVSGIKIYNPISFRNRFFSEDTRKEKTILCVSRLDIKDKGIDSLVKLADVLPDGWRVKLVGSGNENELKKLNALLKKMKNRKKFVFLGPKRPMDLEEIYQQSSFFVSPSLYEGFGLSLVEAMNFGLPIIAFETSGAREITEEGKFGILVKDFSSDKLIKECLMFVNNNELIERYAKLSHFRSQEFAIKNIKKQWVSLLND